MTVAQSIVYRYFAVDSDHDITSDVVQVSPDQTAWTAAAWVTDDDVIAALNAQCKAPAAGLTRYWAKVLTGPDDFPLVANDNNTTFGKVTDAPEVPQFRWTYHVDL